MQQEPTGQASFQFCTSCHSCRNTTWCEGIPRQVFSVSVFTGRFCCVYGFVKEILARVMQTDEHKRTQSSFLEGGQTMILCLFYIMYNMIEEPKARFPKQRGIKVWFFPHRSQKVNKIPSIMKCHERPAQQWHHSSCLCPTTATTWRMSGSRSAADRKALCQTSPTSLYQPWMTSSPLQKSCNSLKDSLHPAHHLSELLSSSKTYRSVKTHTT